VVTSTITLNLPKMDFLRYHLPVRLDMMIVVLVVDNQTQYLTFLLLISDGDIRYFIWFELTWVCCLSSENMKAHFSMTTTTFFNTSLWFVDSNTCVLNADLDELSLLESSRQDLENRPQSTYLLQ
jgi:hypothetical protein